MTSIIQIHMIIIYQLIYAKPSTTAVTTAVTRTRIIAYDNTRGGIHPTYFCIVML